MKRRFLSIALAAFLLAVLTVITLFPVLIASAQSSFVGRPIVTVDAGSWSAVGAASLHEATNETDPNDATDYMISTTDPDWANLTLSPLQDPGRDINHTIRVTALGNGAGTETLQLYLRENGIVISSSDVWTLIEDVWTIFEYTFSTSQISEISDYTNLSVTVHIPSLGGEVQVTQIEFEISGIPVSPFWETPDGIAIIMGIIIILVLIGLGIVLSPIILSMAGIGGFFLAFVIYDSTGSMWLTGLFAFLGFVLLFAGAFNVKRSGL